MCSFINFQLIINLMSLHFCMGSFLFSFLSCALIFSVTSSGELSTHSIYPNFTASNLQYVNNSGAFLVSLNGTFKACISNPKPQLEQYYFSIIHVPSNTIIWTANRNQSISNSDELSLTTNGLIITNKTSILWSTPKLNSQVSVMQLQDSGNLVLLDIQNVSLWESFDYPTDAIVIGQRLHVGKSLEAALNEDNLSVGDYRLIVTDGDAILQWNGMTYWKLSRDINAYKDNSIPVSFLAVTETGMYLYGDDGSTAVIQVILSTGTVFRIAKLGSKGRLTVSSFANNSWVQEFVMPSEDCKIPSICGRIGLCSTGSICSCPPGFHIQQNDDCVPTDTSLTLPSVCNATGNESYELNSSVSYLKLGDDVDYFANDLMDPVKHGVSLTACEDLCSQNCSCLGIFHENSSGSCYLIESYLGSFIKSSVSKIDHLGYIKALVVNESSFDKDQKGTFPVAGLVLLPSSGLFLLLIISIVGYFYWRRKKLSRTAVMTLGSRNSASEELEMISIPGLPVRFDYEALAAATENFRTQIGSGGFSTVYKGTMPDETVVAVKKIISLGIQGKKEFCTEIAIIGNIHHVNLVKLKGFCAQGRQRFLVFEYMNRGSLDTTLFSNGPVLEWQERFEIALGTARGLAYLHNGCEHKIIHCDVKPENILLHDNLQVKISDFGLSKLLSPEQSSLFTTMRGTRGYLAPEWLTNSSISDKTDVYSYGMVLLEIVRGRKNCSLQTWTHRVVDNSSRGSGPSSSSSGWESRLVYFPLLALEMHELRRYLELADPRLEGRVMSAEVEKLVRVALCCLHVEPMMRPTMANVVSMLEGGMRLGEPRIQSLNFLRSYGQRFTEASTIEGSDEQNEFVLNSHANATSNSATSGSYNSLSFISSQQVSGPR